MSGCVGGVTTVQTTAFLFYTQCGSFLFQKDFKIQRSNHINLMIKIWRQLEQPLCCNFHNRQASCLRRNDQALDPALAERGGTGKCQSVERGNLSGGARGQHEEIIAAFPIPIGMGKDFSIVF